MTDKKVETYPASSVELCANCFAAEGRASLPKLSACARCGLVAYCSRDCQRAHWKSNHKQHCDAKSDQFIQQQQTLKSSADSISSARTLEDFEEECVICLTPLTEAPAATLHCNHVFHAACVAELRKFGIKQTCPLCRTPLPPGPQKLSEDATWHYMSVSRLVARSEASWSSLSAEAAYDLGSAITGWRAAAEEGFS